MSKSILFTVSNKKTHLAVFKICAFRVYLRNYFSYEKVIYIYLHPCVTKSADVCKNAVLPEKSKVFEKIRHFEKLKETFSHRSNV